MSDQGVFTVHRGVWDHPVFAPEPFTEREAWLWMLSAAAWEEKRVRVGNAIFDLKRGQLAFATRFLSNKFKWSHSKIVRFLNRLKIETMVSTLATREATLITICNYNEYQFGRNTDETPTGTPTGTEVKRARNKEEELKNYKKEEVSKKETREVALFSDPPDFDEFWGAWPNKVGKPAAARAYNSAIKRGAKPSEIVDGISSYIRDKPPDRPWLNPATFLNQNRWEDKPAQVQNGKTSNVLQAADNLVSILDSFDRGAAETDAIRGPTGAPNVRLISQG